ncbi:MAG: hypothetical protein ACKO2D_01035 [Chloroflexota bacterium]|jgi:hypothetical protein|nr:hypothetical protein [Chloroflexota bacterium]
MAAINLGLATERMAYATTPRFTRLRPFRLRRRRTGPVGAASRAVGAIGALALYGIVLAFAPIDRLLGVSNRRRERAEAWTASPFEPPPLLARPMRVTAT